MWIYRSRPGRDRLSRGSRRLYPSLRSHRSHRSRGDNLQRPPIQSPAPDAIEPATYGPAADTLRGVLRSIEGFQWFPVHAAEADLARATDLLTQHFGQLQALGSDLPS